jgi:hypothetical protein
MVNAKEITTPRTSSDSLSKAIGQWINEHRRELWPHLHDFEWPVTAPTKRQYNGFNPFAIPKTRASALANEVPRLYGAVSFLMWAHGLVINAHLTINWGLLGVTDHRRAAMLLSRYNHEAAKWLKVGDTGRLRKRLTKRAWGGGSSHFFVYVHEHARDHGFHTHELIHVPRHRAQAFAEWSRLCLARLAGVPAAPEAAVYFSPATKKKGFVPYSGKNEGDEVARCWRWFRYIVKSLHPDHVERDPNGMTVRSAREVFELNESFIETEPVHCRKLAGCSENIAVEAQRKAGFTSKFASGDWHRLYDGFELEECRRRLRDEAAARECDEFLRNLKI